MKEWFMTDPLRAALLCVAVPATVIMILQTVMIFIGMAGHSDVDMPDDNGIDGVFGNDSPDAPDVHMGDSGLRIFTVRGMVAFFAVGGWAGLSALSLSGSPSAAIITSLIAGTLALLLVAWFFKWAASLNENGTLQMDSAVGKVGEVYITVPPDMTGTGKVNVIIQGRLTEAEAMTECSRPLKYGEPVEVIGMAVGNTLMVKPIKN
ncbi:MAG: hypothetical protein IIZ08_06710 [Clostridia bacterium]|jgi:membrane protein implicated in regulation of membrane protease activity|nr:hypothetical protein [Clostridia bacterium]